MKRTFLIVLDSLGMGAMPDAAKYGDEGSDTLRAVASDPAFRAPNMQSMGIFNIEGVNQKLARLRADRPTGAFARMAEASEGKDTTTGHWEIAGIVTQKAFPTYPRGFPRELIDEYARKTGHRILCNRPYSGTEVLRDYGGKSVEQNALIVYTSADSVFQVAAHEEATGLRELYRCCEIARAMLAGEHRVARVIARPFTGRVGSFARTAGRHDYSVRPGRPTMLDALERAGLDVIGVGKIYDIFAGRGVTERVLTAGNADGMDKAIETAKRDFEGLCFVNLVDFDMLYGHRNDVGGYARAVSDFDRRLGELLPLLSGDDVLMITADHGCDPSSQSTDHSREYVPLLVYGARVRPGADLGTRGTFADVGASILDAHRVPNNTEGASFMGELAFSPNKKAPR